MRRQGARSQTQPYRFRILQIFENYAVSWPAALSLKPRFLPSIQNGTLLTGTFQGSEVSAWLSQGALRKTMSFVQVESEWAEALTTQKTDVPRYVAQVLFVDSGGARIFVQTRSPASESHALAFLLSDDILESCRTVPLFQEHRKSLWSDRACIDFLREREKALSL